MPLYETIFIARQDVSATQVDSLADGIEKIVTDNSGSVERREYWGLRTLAYRIKKNRKGHYVLFNLDAPSEAIQEMERNMSLNEDIFRFMTVRLDNLRDDASPIMQGKGDRDRDRADRSNRRDRPEEDPKIEVSENTETKPGISESENMDEIVSHGKEENEQ